MRFPRAFVHNCNSDIEFKPATPPYRRRQLYAFTLLELIIVCVIIFILAAITFPVFGRARQLAQRTACATNMHHSALSIALYAEDYDSEFPTYHADPESASHPSDFLYWHDHFCRAVPEYKGETSWVSLAIPYMNRLRGGISVNSNALHCPADQDRTARPLTSYEYKLWLAGGEYLDQVSNPANMALLWEEWAYHTDGEASEHDRRAQMNIVFVDSHASWIRLSDTTSARFGTGPDLHWSFVGLGTAEQYTGSDVAR